MTNEEAQLLIRNSESKIRTVRLMEPVVYWIFTLFIFIFGLLSFSMGTAIPILFMGIGMALWSFYRTKQYERALRHFERDKAGRVWSDLVESGVFGSPIVATARGLSGKIQGIYSTYHGADMLPLPQAIRLFEVYCHHRESRNSIEKRLDSLHSIREELLNKTALLSQLGEERTISREIKQIDAEIEPLEELRDRIAGSYRRLETIVSSVSKTLEAHRLHRELDELSARLPHASSTIEPAFAPESLEEIERQIGREIETYLRLERETDAHLR